MQPHQQRVIDEKIELDAKIGRLEPFFSTTTYAGLPDDEQVRLRKQLRRDDGVFHYSRRAHRRIFMKTIALTILADSALVACTTDPVTGKQTINQTEVASLASLAVDLAAAHFGVSPESATAIKAAAAQLAGIAAQAQANMGKTPASANVAQGSAIPVVGTAVQAALPNTPISQTTVNQLFAAAAATKTVTAP